MGLLGRLSRSPPVISLGRRCKRVDQRSEEAHSKIKS